METQDPCGISTAILFRMQIHAGVQLHVSFFWGNAAQEIGRCKVHTVIGIYTLCIARFYAAEITIARGNYIAWALR
jgi:hypothetical protein